MHRRLGLPSRYFARGSARRKSMTCPPMKFRSRHFSPRRSFSTAPKTNMNWRMPVCRSSLYWIGRPKSRALTASVKRMRRGIRQSSGAWTIGRRGSKPSNQPKVSLTLRVISFCLTSFSQKQGGRHRAREGRTPVATIAPAPAVHAPLSSSGDRFERIRWDSSTGYLL